MHQPMRYDLNEDVNTPFFDEERNRFIRPVFTSGNIIDRLHPGFTTQRPDFYGIEYQNFFMGNQYAWRVLRHFQRIRSRQNDMLNLSFRHLTYYKAKNCGEDLLRHHDFDSKPIGIPRLWHWDDATRNYHWFHLNMMRLTEYGMNMPLWGCEDYSHEDVERKEKELTKYFVEEMSKRPKVIPYA